MAIQPTTRTILLDKDIAASAALPNSLGTLAREQLSVILSVIDSQIQSASVSRTALQGQLDGERSPLRMTCTGTNKIVTVAGGRTTRTDSAGNTSTLLVPIGSTVSNFPGATIDFAGGIITYQSTPATTANFTLCNFSGQAGNWSKYAILLVPGTPNTLQIVAGSSFASTMAAAAEPSFSGSIVIGFVAVQDSGTGGTGTINNIAKANLEQAYSVAAGSSNSGVIALNTLTALYDCIVGSAAQFASGIAGYTSIQSAINAAPTNGRILVLRGTYTENVTLGKPVYLDCQSYMTTLSGTLTLNSGGNFSVVRLLRFGGNVTVNASGCFLEKCYLAPGFGVTNTGQANSIEYIAE